MGLKIHNLPLNERPREKAIRFGFDKLSDAEVLAIIISSGTKDCSAIDLSNIVLSNFGGLYNTINKSFNDFLSFKGIKSATASKLCAIFEIARRYNFKRLSLIENNIEINNSYIFQKYSSILNEFETEKCFIIVLNKRKKIIHETEQFLGSEVSIDISIRDILKTVISHSGYYFYVIHNHPSGSSYPSMEDEAFTLKLIKSCKNVGIKLLDHLIISKKGYFSFLSNGVKEETNENND